MRFTQVDSQAQPDCNPNCLVVESCSRTRLKCRIRGSAGRSSIKCGNIRETSLHFRHALSMVVYLKSLNRKQYSNRPNKLKTQHAATGGMVYHVYYCYHVLHNAVCEDSANWADSAVSVIICTMLKTSKFRRSK